jgi:hypothetical protein
LTQVFYFFGRASVAGILPFAKRRGSWEFRVGEEEKKKGGKRNMDLAAARCSQRLPALRVAHPSFLIDRGYRLGMSVTPAISAQMPFLIVAESRFPQITNRKQNLVQPNPLFDCNMAIRATARAAVRTDDPLRTRGATSVTTTRPKVAGTARENLGALGPNAKERMARGKDLRERVPRAAHSKWTPAPGRPDPVELLKHTDRGRVKDLIPIRYGRMRQSPFAFFRGSAALMASDLAKTPATGIRVQSCGDCHAANFGGFGSPERRLVFDINDFDETLRAPWEWDLKRLSTSVVLAGRQLGARERHCADAARVVAESYREHMREYASMRALDAWYSHLDA